MSTLWWTIAVLAAILVLLGAIPFPVAFVTLAISAMLD